MSTDKTITGMAYAGWPKPVNWNKFADLILSHGGNKVVFAPEDEAELDRMMTRGKLYDLESRLILMQRSNCHGNSAKLWHENRSVTIVTGMALSDDGYWRRHSWVLTDGHIVETTVKRVKYFGYELTQAESQAFHKENP